MASATITSKGHITIPQEIKDYLNLDTAIQEGSSDWT